MMKRMIMCLLLMIVLLIGCEKKENLTSNAEENTPTSIGEFQYTEDTSGAESCYISVVYVEGYAYSPNSWLSTDGYSKNHRYEKGEKIGEVTLDLKNKIYTGIPPSFSSTHDVGTEIYSVEGIKTERAILVVENGYETIFFRERKSIVDENEPIDLTLNEVIEMMTDSSEVIGIELRSVENGAWMNTLNNDLLNRMVGDTLSDSAIMNRGELDSDPYSSYRIPVNLMFKDGAALHMQIYPKTQYALVFGGYIQVPESFIQTLEEEIKKSNEYATLDELLFYGDTEIKYMKIDDLVTGSSFRCKEPQWTAEALASVLSYYRVNSIEKNDSKLIMTFEFGSSENDLTRFELYEDSTVKIDDVRYEILKGSIEYEDIKTFMDSYTYHSF